MPHTKPKILNVRPSLSVLDRVDSGLRNGVDSCQLFLRDTYSEGVANFHHVFLGQFAVRVLLAFADGFGSAGVVVSVARWMQAVCGRVFHVFSWRQVFQIVPSVVSFVGVFVVDLFSFRARTDKSLGDKLVNVDLDLPATGNAKPDTVITAFVRVGAQKFLSRSPFKLASEALDTPKIRHLITTVKTLDRFPNLNFVHTAIISRSPYNTEVYC